MKMNWMQKRINEHVGESIREARKAKGLTQEEVIRKLYKLYRDEVEKIAEKSDITPEEIDLYFEVKFEDLDISIQRKFKKIGISDSYVDIIPPTISHYENGISTIPAHFVVMINKILGDFINLSI